MQYKRQLIHKLKSQMRNTSTLLFISSFIGSMGLYVKAIETITLVEPFLFHLQSILISMKSLSTNYIPLIARDSSKCFIALSIDSTEPEVIKRDFRTTGSFYVFDEFQ